jgi:uncharacterized damage-inducible protein DinB
MHEPMTKARLLDLLRTRRAEWDALLAQIPEGWMTEPGAAGYWSVKDVIAHLSYYERWYADRLHEQLRGENYAPQPIDLMHFDERNAIIYEQNRDRPLEAVRAESREVFQRLIEGVEAHTEAFLTEPHEFEGAPGPVLIWQMLRGDVYDHYPQHMPSIREWLADMRG